MGDLGSIPGLGKSPGEGIGLHVCGIQKNGTDEPGKAEDTDIENKDGHKRGKVGWDELGDWD